MGPFLSEFVKVMRVVLQFIGGTTVIGFLGWLYKRRQENFEDSVLLMFEMDPHQQLRTVEGIHSDYIGRCLKDVPTWVVIAPPNVNTRWTRFKWRLRTVPYQVRHVWRRFFFIPDAKKVEKTVLHLWKRGLLVRDEAKPKYYKLKK